MRAEERTCENKRGEERRGELRQRQKNRDRDRDRDRERERERERGSAHHLRY